MVGKKIITFKICCRLAVVGYLDLKIYSLIKGYILHILAKFSKIIRNTTEVISLQMLFKTVLSSAMFLSFGVYRLYLSSKA
jgi:hypothetical protein